MVQAWSEMEDWYGTGSLTGEQGLAPATEASGALVLDEAFLDLVTPEGVPNQASTLAEQLMELSLSSCPKGGTEDSDIEEGASRRRFSCLFLSFVKTENVNRRTVVL